MSVIDRSEAVRLSGSHVPGCVAHLILVVMEGGHILYCPNRGPFENERGLY